MNDAEYSNYIAEIIAELGIAPEVVQQRALPLCKEAQELVTAQINGDIKKQLEPNTANAWIALRDAAAQESITLYIASAFRSVVDQAKIIQRKLARGQTLDEIMRVSALPGYSQHHTGRAIDIGTPGFADLEEEFEHSAAFLWLQKNAGDFGFSLSYPRNNAFGYIYEPWHWYYSESLLLL